MMALATTEPETVPGPEAAAEEERKANADISAMARGGLLNLVGAAGTGIFTFALVTVLTRGLGAASYGAFVSAMGLFTILSNTAELGADTGLVAGNGGTYSIQSVARLREGRVATITGVVRTGGNGSPGSAYTALDWQEGTAAR